ncbi:hypothetical protein ACFX15_027712 [Malus domestica]
MINFTEMVCFIERICVQKIQGSTNPTMQKVFGGASFFSPLLFGNFFNAFPLWEFESDILLSGLRSSGQNCIDWFQIDQDYVGPNSKASSRLWVESRCQEAEAYEETATKEEEDR